MYSTWRGIMQFFQAIQQGEKEADIYGLHELSHFMQTKHYHAHRAAIYCLRCLVFLHLGNLHTAVEVISLDAGRQ